MSCRLNHLSISILMTTFIGASAMGAGSYPKPDICDRDCWVAREPSNGISQMSDLTRAIIHHTAIATDYDTTSLEESKAKVRAIQSYHMDVNGWSDIGYHFLGDKLGNGFEGREGAIDGLPRGAHDGVNDQSFGFSMMGYFHEPYYDQPTVEQRCQIYEMIAWKVPDPFTAYGAGSYGSGTVGYLGGHRDVKSTACPGDVMYDGYIGEDVYDGEARNEINGLITTGVSDLCGDPGPQCCPEAPTLLGATNLGDGSSLFLEWTEVSRVDGYRLEGSPDGVSFVSVAELPPGSTRYLDDTLSSGEDRYYRVFAIGTDQDSPPSDVYGARAAAYASSLLVVDGNDRWVTQAENTSGGNHNFAALAGIAITDIPFDTTDNEEVAGGRVSLTDYDGLIWLLGEESTAHETLSNTEQGLLSEYLDQGGQLFISGAEIGWDLAYKGSTSDGEFYQNYLRALYISDDAETYTTAPRLNGLFYSLGNLDFSPVTMDVDYPDVIAPWGGSIEELYYGDTSSEAMAGLSYDGSFRIVYFGFPFESLSTETARNEVMTQVIDFFGLEAISGSISVSSLETGFVGLFRKRGLATVQVVDGGGTPIGGVTVLGTFSGDLQETVAGLTDGAGNATLTTSSVARGPLEFTFCVDGLDHDAYAYSPDDNTLSCQDFAFTGPPPPSQ